MHRIILSDGAVLASGADGTAIRRVTVTKSVCSSEELTVGTVCAAVAEIELMDTGGLCPLKTGAEFTLYRDEEKIGIFTVETPKRQSSTRFLITAYDPVAKLNRNLDTWLQSLTGWPYQMEDFARMVCEVCGVTLSDEPIPGGIQPVPAIRGNGITGRQLLSWVGEVAGCFLRARPTGELEFAWYTPGNVTVGTEEIPIFGGTLQYADYETEKIQKIQIRKEPTDVGLIYPESAGENTYILEGNPILTGGEGDVAVAQRLYEQLKDITYRPFSAEVPVGRVKPGELINVTTAEGTTFSSLIMTVESRGGRDKISSTGYQSRQSVSARNDFSLSSLAGKIMTLQTDLNGIRAENKDGDGKAAALQLTVDSLRAEISRQSAQLKSGLTRLEQTAENLKIDVQTVRETGAGKVTTSTGYTFDETGLHIRKDGEEMANRLDHTGMYVHRSGEVILRADASGVLATDVQVKNYLHVGEHARFQDYDGGTGCFYL